MRINILLTSVGRRVSLVNFFKEALDGAGSVYSADCDPTAPGLYVAHKSFLVPKVTDKEYIPYLLDKCKKENIKMVIPLIDPELPILAIAREIFLGEGIIPLVSSYETIMIGYDKLLTYKFLIENGFSTPKTISIENSLLKDKIGFPIIIKPRFGSASIGVQKCENYEDVEFYSRKISDPILQDYLQGSEITSDVLCDFEGNLLSIVQRKRLKVRGGEVERGITIKNSELLSLTSNLVTKLKPFGVINIQCFSTENGFYFTEINPRFGGGYPLSYYAGVNFPKLIVKLLEGKLVKPCIGEYEEGILMLRYDEGVFIYKDKLLK